MGYLFSFFFLQVHFLYQFSLQFFLDIFQCVLYENPKLKSLKDPQQRLKVLCSDVFQVNIASPLIYYEWPVPPPPEGGNTTVFSSFMGRVLETVRFFHLSVVHLGFRFCYAG